MRKLGVYISLIISFLLSSAMGYGQKSAPEIARMDTILMPEYNYFQFYNRELVEQFVQQFEKSSQEKVSIVHFGDSHIQADISTSEVRKKLQKEYGAAGRGMIFPYSTARTYSSTEYKTNHSGKWTYAKSMKTPPKYPLGMVGMTSRTTDTTAGFVISFKEPREDINTRLRVYCKKQLSSFDLEVIIDEESSQLIKIDTSGRFYSPFIEIPIPILQEKIECNVIKTDDHQREFEIYGMELLNESDTGIVLHAVGVGASQYHAMLYLDLLDEQLPFLEPDIIVLDFGTNDYLYYDRIPGNLENTINRSIDNIRKIAPEAIIILGTTQDMYRYGWNLKSGIPFGQLIHKIAKAKDCLVYDWFWIAGGQQAMKYWLQNELAQKDRVHLSKEGYKLKGNLFTDAIYNTLAWHNENDSSQNLAFDIDSLIKVAKVDEFEYGEGIWHVIQPGECLGVIARNYGVTITQIKLWNNMYSDRIIAGKKLWIGRP